MDNEYERVKDEDLFYHKKCPDFVKPLVICDKCNKKIFYNERCKNCRNKKENKSKNIV